MTSPEANPSGGSPRSLRVFLGLSNICGYYSQLEMGLRANGVSCVLVDAFPDREYARETQPDLLGRCLERIARKRASQRSSSAGRLVWKGLQALMQLAYCILTLGKFDAYVFASGYSFFFGYDLALLKILGKRIIVVFHGTDARPPYMNAAIVGTDGEIDAAAVIDLTRRTKKFIANMERRADVIVNHSLTAHFHERPVVTFLSIGIPQQPREPLAAVLPPEKTGRTCVIAHAPTRPGPKGTDRIERAVESLLERGFGVRLNKIIGRPNAEVLEAIAGSDFVVDELFSDTTMASFATEAASFGKAAIVGMFGYEALRQYTPPEMLPPAFVCTPDGVEPAIEKLVVDAELRESIGLSARAFLEDRWNRDAVGKRFLCLVTGQIPEEWWFEARALRYFHGWGLTEERLRYVLGALIDAGGAGALCVEDKPELERSMLAFAGRALPC